MLRPAAPTAQIEVTRPLFGLTVENHGFCTGAFGLSSEDKAEAWAA